MSLNIFISYSSQDLEHVGALQTELSSTPIKVYIAEKSLPPGRDISADLTQAIQTADAFVLVWSHSASRSEWVLQEIGQALVLRKPILPIVLDSDLKLPESIAHLKFISFATNPSGAMRDARDFLYSNYESRHAHIAAEARAKEEKDNIAKLALAGLAFWLFTRK